MSLERKDVRLKLDPDVHEMLVSIAAARDCDISELAEGWVEKAARRTVHEAMVLTDRLTRRGIVGKIRE